MPDVMKTLLLNPPSFENFDGGASSRWPATREIESYWYPVWLTYPAGLIPGSRLLDASPHKVNWRQTIEICKDYEFLILFTSTVGLESDVKLIRKIKEANPSMKIAFVGPHGHIKPEETLNASEDIDFVTRGEFDHSVVDYAHGKPLSEIQGVSYRKDGKVVHNAERPQLHTEELDALPFATDETVDAAPPLMPPPFAVLATPTVKLPNALTKLIFSTPPSSSFTATIFCRAGLLMLCCSCWLI